jgi:hypothetical protein
MSSSPHDRLLTPTQLVQKYPAVELFCWTPSVVGALYNFGLMLGKRTEKANIYESSFINLVGLANQVAANQKVILNTTIYEFWTPQEIIEEYPELLRVWYWDASTIGTILSARLLNGSKHKEHSAHILLPSFWTLVDYVNNIKDQQKLNLMK